ncbi:heavy metal-binding protein [Pollutimonas nitritireducens]|uniref:Heavy metal-binding protein n=1 Tax=Pollutimonas nitritireducens TaxID=2045209 RepID=A0A2N4UGV7_9BURK|nr:heavy-metal-associated domain-containing protein [Pollutimonas nitritireducens]PLC54261.1 heavy metal-binding protein [Pollutimonas nitritireducens]
MKKAVYQMQPFSCPSCIRRIEGALLKQPGVRDARLLFHSAKARVEFDESIVDATTLGNIIASLGYTVLSKKVA